MNKDEEALRNSDGFKRALKEGLEAMNRAAVLAKQRAINDAHDKVVDLSPSEWSEKPTGP